MATVAVLGAGSWGTALAIQLARCGHGVLLWGRGADVMARIAAERRNLRYLPDVRLSNAIEPIVSLERACTADELLVAVPTYAFRETLAGLAPGVQRLAWATKGLEEGSGRLLHEVAAELLGAKAQLAALSGPTFAREVAEGLPTAITVAANDSAYAERIATMLHGDAFRVYTSADLCGVGLGGAVKNVIAIAAGMADGLGLGANSRAALITRGLAEMMRLGRKLGARSKTLMGLAGLGDLVLTCTDDQSRNRRFGLALARGVSAEDAAKQIGQVVEGARTAAAVRLLSHRHGVELPICDQVHRVLQDGVAPRRAVAALMERARRSEED
ncbi:MAG TPA: NAD(P)H-dependent glycerol-3-phosphate dehydrogenase [Alphaproteobacteria bacterium]|nr:NAD(P)H-dependent glycerol-3-phosphate dehydrogenase [Alphaproteobacteria bacterium]